MASFIRNLPDDWTLLKRSENWNAESGKQVVFTLEGPSTSATGPQYDLVNQVLAVMPAGYTQWRFEGQVWDVRQDDDTSPPDPADHTFSDAEGGKGTLTVTYQATGSNPDASGDPDPDDTSDRKGLIALRWTREYTELDWPPQQSPYIQAIWDKGTAYQGWINAVVTAAAAYRSLVKQDQEDAKDGSTVVVRDPLDLYPYAYVPAGQGTPDTTYCLELYATLIVNPEIAYEERVPVLRKEMEVATYTELRAADAYEEQVMSWDFLTSYEPTLANSLATSGGLNTWSWLKLPANVTQENFGTYRITQEYKALRNWPNYLYGPELTTWTPGTDIPAPPTPLA